MLVLQRKQNEKIVIGDNVVMTVVSIRGDRVKLGFDAPITTPINRKEIHDAIQAGRNPKGEANG